MNTESPDVRPVTVVSEGETVTRLLPMSTAVTCTRYGTPPSPRSPAGDAAVPSSLANVSHLPSRLIPMSARAFAKVRVVPVTVAYARALIGINLLGKWLTFASDDG